MDYDEPEILRSSSHAFCPIGADVGQFSDAGVQSVDLDTVFQAADVVSLHAPLTATSRHLVNASRIATMKPEAVIINTSRGGLVDFEAVADALKNGRLGGAGLDVLENDPPHQNQHPLLMCQTLL